MDSREDCRRKLWEKIKDVKFGMLTTFDPVTQTLRSRPMANQQVEFDGTLWFFTTDTSAKSQEISQDHHVNVSYADPDDNLYVSVSGFANVVHDRAKIKELWNPIYKAWFPDGLDDPHLALLRVDVTQAEYWDSPNSTMVQLYAFAKSVLTGESAYNAGEHARLNDL